MLSTCDQETLLLRAVSELGTFCVMITAILCLLPPRHPSFTNYDIWDGKVVLTPGCVSPGMLFIWVPGSCPSTLLCNQPQVIFGLVIGDPPKNESLQASKSEEFLWPKWVKRKKGSFSSILSIAQGCQAEALSWVTRFFSQDRRRLKQPQT